MVADCLFGGPFRELLGFGSQSWGVEQVNLIGFPPVVASQVRGGA